MKAEWFAWRNGIWSLLERSLRIDARLLSQHAFRFASVLAVYAAIVISESSGGSFGAPGLRYFRQLAYVNLAFIALAGVGYFAAAITEEKEEDTLGLMLMAGISPVGILLGKAGGRLIQTALLLAVQFPFAWLAITLGGVTREQIFQTYVSLAAYLVLLANVALCCSVVCRQTRSASSLTFVWQVLYFLLPWLASELYSDLQNYGWRMRSGDWETAVLWTLIQISHSSVVYQLQEILATGAQTSLMSVQVVSNLLGGAAAFCLARWLFDWGARDVAQEATPRGVFSLGFGGRWYSPGPVGTNALAWKEFHFTCGGWPMVAARVLAYAALFAFITYEVRYDGHTDWRVIGEMYFVFGQLALFFDAAWSVSRALHDEIKLQTWPALVMLPKTFPELLYAKVLGVLISLAPSVGCLLFVLCSGCVPAQVVSETFNESEVWVVYAMGFALIHLTALYSVLVKWGALPLAVATLVALIYLWGELFLSSTGAAYYANREAYNAFAIFALLCGCGVCHILIGQRLRFLASQ